MPALEIMIATDRRGECFDMDQALEDLLRGEKFYAAINGRTRYVEVTRVWNAGFRGQEVHFKIVKPNEADTKIYGTIATSGLPTIFVNRMIKKYKAQKKS